MNCNEKLEKENMDFVSTIGKYDWYECKECGYYKSFDKEDDDED